MATLRFAGKLIPGTPGPIQVGRLQSFGIRTHFFGLKGVSYIKGGTGGRMLMVKVLVHNSTFTNPQSLEAFFKELDSKLEVTGKLEIVGFQRFDDCQFLGYQTVALPGQDGAGPLYDAERLLPFMNNSTWYQCAEFYFEQLKA